MGAVRQLSGLGFTVFWDLQDSLNYGISDYVTDYDFLIWFQIFPNHDIH